MVARTMGALNRIGEPRMGRTPKKRVLGRHVSFSLQAPSDMLGKLEWEITAMHRYLDEGDFRGPSICALNACITAWHLGDWVARTLDEVRRWDVAERYFGRSMSTLFDLQAEMRTSEDLVACQQIAAAAKHKHIDENVYRAGFFGAEFFDFYYAEPVGSEEPRRIIPIRALEVSFPIDGDDPDAPRRKKSVALVLDDAYQWWASALHGMGLDAGSRALRSKED